MSFHRISSNWTAFRGQNVPEAHNGNYNYMINLHLSMKLLQLAVASLSGLHTWHALHFKMLLFKSDNLYP
jgi:hypothetical protein